MNETENRRKYEILCKKEQNLTMSFARQGVKTRSWDRSSLLSSKQTTAGAWRGTPAGSQLRGSHAGAGDPGWAAPTAQARINCLQAGRKAATLGPDWPMPSITRVIAVTAFKPLGLGPAPHST